MTAAPQAAYCFSHELHYIEAACPCCTQGIPALPRPHAPDLTDLNARWQEAVAREATARCDCPSWACIVPGSVGCYFGEAVR